VSILSVWNILAVHEKMDEKLAYAITKTIFEKKPELVAVHKKPSTSRLRTSSRGDRPFRSIRRLSVFRGDGREEVLTRRERGAAAVPPAPCRRGAVFLFRPATVLEFENAGQGIVARYPVNTGMRSPSHTSTPSTASGG